jgi:hypothetical protein
LRIHTVAGALEPSKCKVLGVGLGGSPIVPGQWVGVDIAAFDALDNKRTQGGGLDRFAFLV